MKAIHDKIITRIDKLEKGEGNVNVGQVIKIIQETPPMGHEHDISDINDFKEKVQDIIAETQPKDHEHEISEVKGLDTKLNEYALKTDFDTHNHDGTYSKEGHTHDISDINKFKTQVQTVISDTILISKES